MMLTSTKLIRRIAALETELAVLRSALEAEAGRARASEQALEEARTTIDALHHTQQELRDRVSAAASSAELDPIERRIEELERQAIQRNRALRLEKQMAQQAEDLQTAVAGLIARIDVAKRNRKTS